jgi:phosphonate transport system substrate-binding protein
MEKPGDHHMIATHKKKPCTIRIADIPVPQPSTIRIKQTLLRARPAAACRAIALQMGRQKAMIMVPIERHISARWPRCLRTWLGGLLCLAGLATFPSAHAQGDTLVLAVQPVLGEAQTREAFKALADFIGKASGKTCVLRTRPNFMAYWETMRKGDEYDFILDAAHFTDYRVKKLGYTILAKIPDSVSYSLVVRDGNLVIDPMELVAKPVATLGIPSIGAARLNAMFPNPVRQPFTVEVDSAEAGVDMVLKGKVFAAILPTPIVSQQMRTGGGLSVVTTTEPIPHIALSAAPSVDAAVRERVRQALLEAEKTPTGKAMLKTIGFERFTAATPALYDKQSQVLQEYWGF